MAARVNSFLQEKAESPVQKATQQQTRISLGVIKTALERYSLEEISLSYNGGKDCLVLLILLLCALATHPARLPRALQSVYVVSPHPFAEVESFVDASISSYRLDLGRYSVPMKEAFRRYLEDRPAVKAIFVGTRRTDPHGANLTYFDPTDHGWPPFMRVHPVIDWRYAEIWTFILKTKISYCSLYNLGYTSLGGTADTHPNPALKAEDGTRTGTFRPAYELLEDSAERFGRDR